MHEAMQRLLGNERKGIILFLKKIEDETIRSELGSEKHHSGKILQYFREYFILCQIKC